MYGKFFASAFNGSMMAAGPEVFAVWAYVIANASADSHVDLNPRLLAAVIGSTPERMEIAILTLCAPDKESRSKAEEGRRLVRVGQFSYIVVNHSAYRAIRNEDDRREYNRIAKQKERARKSNGVKQPVIDNQRHSIVSAHTDTDTDTEEETSIKNDPKPAPKRRGSNGTVHGFPPGFERFWSAYPRKVGKDAAARAFAKRKPDAPMVDAMVVAVEAQKRGEQWVKDGGQFVPHPSTWLNEGRWQDEAPTSPKSELDDMFRRGSQ